MEITAHGLACVLALSKPNDEGWMRATVHLKVPSFEGKFSCTVEINEWQHFIHVLRHLHNSVGADVEQSWSNMEENLEFIFVLRNRGAIEGRYRFSPENFSLGPVLSGSFDADRSLLAIWLRDAQQEMDNSQK